MLLQYTSFVTSWVASKAQPVSVLFLTAKADMFQEAVGQNCTVKEMQYGHIFNLTVLHSPHDGYSLMTEQGDSYLINVCGPLNRSCNGQEASVCLTTQANNSFAVGE